MSVEQCVEISQRFETVRVRPVAVVENSIFKLHLHQVQELFFRGRHERKYFGEEIEWISGCELCPQGTPVLVVERWYGLWLVDAKIGSTFRD